MGHAGWVKLHTQVSFGRVPLLRYRRESVHRAQERGTHTATERTYRRQGVESALLLRRPPPPKAPHDGVKGPLSHEGKAVLLITGDHNTKRSTVSTAPVVRRFLQSPLSHLQALEKNCQGGTLRGDRYMSRVPLSASCTGGWLFGHFENTDLVTGALCYYRPR